MIRVLIGHIKRSVRDNLGLQVSLINPMSSLNDAIGKGTVSYENACRFSTSVIYTVWPTAVSVFAQFTWPTIQMLMLPKTK